MINERAKAILDFCFVETKIDQWFQKNNDFDNILKDNFMNDYLKAINNDYDNWIDSAEECVALVILLDQLSRNFFRNSFKAYSYDTKCIMIVKDASLTIIIHFVSYEYALKLFLKKFLDNWSSSITRATHSSALSIQLS